VDVIQALERRAASRRYSKKEVSLQAIAAILWAGDGIIKKTGKNRTIHGFDAVSAAINNVRHSVPWPWGRPYIKLYVLLQDGAYVYVPEVHRFKFVNQKNLISGSGSSAVNPYGVIVIAADFSQMPSMDREMVSNVAFFTAGSSAQNMYTAGTIHGLQMLTQITIDTNVLEKELKLTDDVVPLVLLSFGFSGQ
jgi:nitroreductase